jgi:fatty-acyl-CoA synthase
MQSQATAIFNAFARSARRNPERRALTYKGRHWTYAGLQAAVESAAFHLNAMGVRQGDRVAFLARNSDAYLVGWLATQALGAMHVPINFMLGAAEVAFILDHAAPRALFVGEEFMPVARKATENAASAMHLRGVSELLDDAPRFEIPRDALDGAAQTAQLAYTSGTESAPKGAMLSDIGLMYEYQSCIVGGEYSGADTIVHALPLYHCAQMHCFLTPNLLLGANNIILERADPGEIIETVKANQATSFFAPPTVWIGLLNHKGMNPEDLRSLKKGYYGASIMPGEVLRGLRKTLPWIRLWNYYGQTEIGPLATVLQPEEHDQRPTSAGRPVLHVESRVVDDDMQDVKPGEIGELVHRSPQLLTAYYRDPVKTAEAFRGGWFHSGDLAVRDPEGYIEIVDRKKDMIKTGGENVASREVEEAIYGNPAVAEVAVIGVPDPKWVERVCAVVVRRAGQSTTEQEVMAATAGLAPFKRPKDVKFVDALPKNPSGKILKRELRKMFGDTFAAQKEAAGLSGGQS